MTDFSGLPLVIEPADLQARLDVPELILVDLTSVNRYDSGHIPGARFVDPKRTQLGQPLRRAYCRPKPIWKSCLPSLATTPMRSTWSMTTRAAAGPDVSSGCWM